ncbi:unnamed protein product [Discosporangium mesarthrocarpum]
MVVDEETQALVLTGPNAGGKTVVLKTLGLVALMVRTGIPIPAASGARVDLFNPILADIGDLQSVTGDLSTFSGHLVVAKAVLEGAKAGALVLMDEMGSGTDPLQGAALAQSLLEALLGSGARVALTTHYLQLKELASTDSRFGVAAMQFVDGKPTYRLVKGAIGESFALQVAERLSLPPAVISRARSLLDKNTRQVSELIQKLEAEREELEVLRATAAEMEASLELQLKRVYAREAEAEELKRTAKQEAAKEYASTVEERERQMKEMFDKAREAMSYKASETSSTQVIGGTLGAIRSIKAIAEKEASELPMVTAEELGLSPLKKRDRLSVGDKVVVCEGSAFGRQGEVTEVGNRDIEVLLSNSRAPIRFPKSRLSLPPPGGMKKIPGLHLEVPQTPEQDASERRKAAARGAGISKKAAAYLEDDMGSGGFHKGAASSDGAGPRRMKDKYLMRLESNTLDLRGMTLSDAREECDIFFSQCIMNGRGGCFLLHGHGTGVLKHGLRKWLPGNSMVKEFRPASQGDGGDAFTMVILA